MEVEAHELLSLLSFFIVPPQHPPPPLLLPVPADCCDAESLKFNQPHLSLASAVRLRNPLNIC